MTVREPFKIFRQKWLLVSFYAAYLIGSIAGTLCVSHHTASLMRLLSYSQMSIVYGFLVSAIPFFVFYIIFRCSVFWLVAPLGFIKALAFMCCFAGISIAYGDAGWLVRFLLLFSDVLSVPLFIWCVGRTLMRGSKGDSKTMLYCLVLVLTIRCIDCYVISPFVSELLLF